MDSYSQFYKENKDQLYAYLLRMTGDPQTAIDLVQESFTRYLSRYKNRKYNKALLYTIARNAALDTFRKQKFSGIDAINCQSPSINPEQEMVQREEFNRMLTAISQLKDSHRELISLVATGELSYQEIGRILKISEANVKVRVHRARKKLQAILKTGGK